MISAVLCFSLFECCSAFVFLSNLHGLPTHVLDLLRRHVSHVYGTENRTYGTTGASWILCIPAITLSSPNCGRIQFCASRNPLLLLHQVYSQLPAGLLPFLATESLGIKTKVHALLMAKSPQWLVASAMEQHRRIRFILFQQVSLKKNPGQNCHTQHLALISRPSLKWRQHEAGWRHPQ